MFCQIENKNNAIFFSNKTPEYSESKNYYFKLISLLVFKCYFLSFIDRSIKTSEKNFQLISSMNNIILQFAESKIENEYYLDYMFPFTPIQAFGIGISSIQNKILC